MHRPPSLDSGVIDELELDDRVDIICDRFERDRASGIDADLGSYLASCQPTERSRLFFELLLVDCEMSCFSSQHPNWDDYLNRFPEHADQIEAVRFRYLSTTISVVDVPALGAGRPPERIEHFQLLKEIGGGGSGTVWKAWDSRLRRLVAVKIPKLPLATDEAVNRFLREGWAAAQLQHPGIVPVHAVGRDNQTAYIVSDYIAGQNLRDYLHDVRLVPRRAAELCLTVAQALHHAHDKGIVHRDLKPANILLDEQNRPHIADFGLAKWCCDDVAATLEGQVLGTPAYMSPEQARGQAGQADCRTDVYALGVVLYEMLTGRRPFEGDYSQVTFQILHRAPPSPRSLDRTIPRDLETICLKALEKQIDHRYATASAMAADLERFLRDEPILARRASLLEKTIRSMRRRPALTAAIALGVIACAAVGLAGRLSEEKRQLLDLHQVCITTEPPGARVTFVPLHPETGRPMPKRLVRSPDKTPLQQELKPGDYVVIATLDDGRFHEVRRRVPRPSNLPGMFLHNRWRKMPDGRIELPTIQVPSQDVNKGMGYFAADVAAAKPDSSGSDALPSFYMDTTEFTVQQYSATLPNWTKQGTPWENVSKTCAMTVRFDEALHLAERNGKRLPSEEEYNRATQSLVGRVPQIIEKSSDVRLGPVGLVKWDQTTTDPPVRGLISNVAEWTTSTSGGHASQGQTLFANATDHLIVHGGSSRVINCEKDLQAYDFGAHLRTMVGRNAELPGLGFRCVRSAVPPYAER